MDLKNRKFRSSIDMIVANYKKAFGHMEVYTIAPSPWKDEPDGFFILRLGTTMVFRCIEGHSWPRTEKYLWKTIRKRPLPEKWTLYIWDGDICPRLTIQDKQDLAAAWRWYKKYRKENETRFKVAGFSLS